MIKLTVYCSFNFESFPFDSHQCDTTFFAIDNLFDTLQIESPEVGFESKLVKYGQGLIQLPQSRLPFDIFLESLETFVLSINGFNHSSAGMRLHFVRNDFGQIFGGYYVPTKIFVLLSQTSYSIDIDLVINTYFQLIFVQNKNKVQNILLSFQIRFLAVLDY